MLLVVVGGPGELGRHPCTAVRSTLSWAAFEPRKVAVLLSHHTVDDLAKRQLRQACAELERRLRAGIACSTEDLLANFPAVAAKAEAALELIYTEFVLRRQLGQKPQ